MSEATEDKTTKQEAVAPVTTDAPAPKTKRKKVKRSVPYAQLHILATFNNTIVSFTDMSGGVLASSSAGACGFRGSKKSTAYAAQVAAEKAAQTVKQLHGTTKVDAYIRGVGLGREAVVRSMQNQDIQVEVIKDVTGVPHGGCRPKKARRV